LAEFVSELKEQIQSAVKDAMRARAKERLGTLRLITAALKQREVDERVELDDPAVLGVLEKMVKQRRDSIAQYEKAGRQELADQESFELTIIQEFMPAALSSSEIEAAVKAAIEQSGAQGPRDMGKVMGLLRDELKGRADMGAVSQLVKAALS
jgi:uncharacterized protein YqeY